MNKHDLGVCVICGEDVVFSPYWYDMKGVECPTTCKKCQAVAVDMEV